MERVGKGGRGQREGKERKRAKGGGGFTRGGLPKYATAAAGFPCCFNNAFNYLSLSLFTSAEDESPAARQLLVR
jgi:hypothetical protein